MRNSTEKQKGFVLVVVAGILIALIGFVALGVDTRPILVAAVDWNRDGKMDLVTAIAESGTVSVLLNQR